jgi:predicted acylesterase/phospholipase RssA
MMRKKAAWAVLVLGLAALVGAIVLPRALKLPMRQPAVPEALTGQAVIPGIPDARYWVGGDLGPFVRAVAAARQREEDHLARTGHTGPLPPADLLAVSGGGDKGAFGAGLLCGWTAAGNRPRFKAVTGVSTGALIAPFAFLGADFDHVLRTVYTSVKPADIAEKRSILAAIQNDGMADNRPLWSLISRFVDAGLLARIAEEHRNGRILLVGTTNLDARQPVIWDVGAIAASGDPKALDLVRKILLASAAIPGAFPPVMVPVQVDGKPFQEMHVDGGASAQVFLYPPRMLAAARAMGEKVGGRSDGGHVYIIRNSRLSATWAPVERRTISIAGRAIDSLIHTQGIGDLYRIYVTTQRDRLDFNLAYIDTDFQYEGEHEQFDTRYMNSLFEYGRRLGQQGYPWKKAPPGLEHPADPQLTN